MGSKTAKTACPGLEADDLGGRAGETWKLVLGKIQVSLLVKRPDRPAGFRSSWEGMAQVSEMDLGRVRATSAEATGEKKWEAQA